MPPHGAVLMTVFKPAEKAARRRLLAKRAEFPLRFHCRSSIRTVLFREDHLTVKNTLAVAPPATMFMM